MVEGEMKIVTRGSHRIYGSYFYSRHRKCIAYSRKIVATKILFRDLKSVLLLVGEEVFML